jgi:hypothetical protein
VADRCNGWAVAGTSVALNASLGPAAGRPLVPLQIARPEPHFATPGRPGAAVWAGAGRGPSPRYAPAGRSALSVGGVSGDQQ